MTSENSAGPGARVASQDYHLSSVDELSVHPSNPRRGNIDALAESIGENDFYGAIVAQRSTGYVLAGNHRLVAARREGLSEVPVIWLDCDDKAAARILLVDNRLNDLAKYDTEALAGLLSTQRELDNLLGTGYSDADVAKLIGDVDAFAPVDDDTRLDQQKVTTCPECGHSFVPSLHDPSTEESVPA